MSTYTFKKYPNAGSNSEWRKSKHVFETDQPLPTRECSIRGKFNGEPADLMMVSERVSGDTHLNERRRIIGFVVQTNADKPYHYFHQTYKPDNVHLLFDYEGYKAIDKDGNSDYSYGT